MEHETALNMTDEDYADWVDRMVARVLPPRVFETLIEPPDDEQADD